MTCDVHLDPIDVWCYMLDGWIVLCVLWLVVSINTIREYLEFGDKEFYGSTQTRFLIENAYADKYPGPGPESLIKMKTEISNARVNNTH